MNRNGMFDAKLQELENGYHQMIQCLKMSQTADHSEIRKTLNVVQKDCLETEDRLREVVNDSRSPVVAALSDAQLQYYHQIRRTLEKALSGHHEGDTSLEKGLEDLALYGEYAIDFAVQAMDYALLAALSALDTQRNLEEETR